jgi:hypothetical protein
MQIAKRVLILYFLGILAIYLHLLLQGQLPTHVSDALLFNFIPVVVLIAGLVIGWFGAMIIQYSKWVNSFYLFGLNLSFAIFLIALGYFQIRERREDRRYGYNRSARTMLELADENGYQYVADGFEKLQGQFKDPRQLHLIEYRTNFRDTVVGSENDFIKTVYYTYFLGKNYASKRFGKVEIWKTRVTLLSIDQLPNSDTCYQRLNESFELKKRMVDSLISTLKLDSLSRN